MSARRVRVLREWIVFTIGASLFVLEATHRRDPSLMMLYAGLMSGTILIRQDRADRARPSDGDRDAESDSR